MPLCKISPLSVQPFAVGTRLLDLSGEREAAREWPIKYARIGLPYIGALAERLREFEADRARYPTLMDFYPRLVDAIEELARGAAAEIPFQGGIRAILDSPAARTVILPGEEAPGVGAALRRLAADRWKGAAVLTDAEALRADLKGRTLIVIGTATGNRWLRRHLSELQLPYLATTAFYPRIFEMTSWQTAVHRIRFRMMFLANCRTGGRLKCQATDQ